MTSTIDQLAEHIGLELRDNSTIAVIRKIESDLAYRTPGSNRPLAHVVLRERKLNACSKQSTPGLGTR